MTHKPLPDGRCEHRWRNRTTHTVRCRYAEGWLAARGLNERDGPDPRAGLPVITDAVLDQWENSAEYDMERGEPWATNPAAILAAVYELREGRLRDRAS